MSTRLRASEIVFVDVEASGLGDRCYPIEVGYVRFADLSGWSALIRPTVRWISSGRWEAKAESLHGITPEMLVAEGLDAAMVAETLNRELHGTRPFSDAPDFDGHWLGLLFSASWEKPAFVLRNTSILLSMSPADLDLDVTPPPLIEGELAGQLVRHRAFDDAMRMAIDLWKRMEPA
jgi:hypothetical protein